MSALLTNCNCHTKTGKLRSPGFPVTGQTNLAPRSLIHQEAARTAPPASLCSMVALSSWLDRVLVGYGAACVVSIRKFITSVIFYSWQTSQNCAPIAQRIEQWCPKPCAQVRVLAGAPLRGPPRPLLLAPKPCHTSQQANLTLMRALSRILARTSQSAPPSFRWT